MTGLRDLALEGRNDPVGAQLRALVYIGDQIGRLQRVDVALGAERLARALTRIRDYAEDFGGGPPDDEMREIARAALHDEALSRAARVIADCLDRGPTDPTMIASRVLGTMEGVSGGGTGE